MQTIPNHLYTVQTRHLVSARAATQCVQVKNRKIQQSQQQQ